MKDEQLEVLLFALNSMRPRPRNLVSTYGVLARAEGVDGDLSLVSLAEHLEGSSVTDPLRTLFAKLLVQWDAAEATEWVAQTERNSLARRAHTYDALRVDQALGTALDEVARVVVLAPPVVIDKEHEDWYTARRRQDRAYWDSYQAYLGRKGWEPRNIGLLDISTDRVIERLADPYREGAYGARGSVVGYVQSGKTANFTGVMAKAVDAGYRLIIVLSGTLNILRDQTQRRLDMELVGREQLAAASPDEYDDNDPDWRAGRFNEHGGLPAALGTVGIDRLTTAKGEYESVESAIRALYFEKVRKDLPLNDALNIGAMPVRLMVVKKNASVLQKLLDDLGRVPDIERVPALIVDDESDQASVNTARPTASEKRNRTAINERIVSLLKLLKRGQYIGYTATPFANVFVDPDDEEDLFPRDFLVPLERPDGYMGVSNFHDLEPLSDDVEPTPANSNEAAYVRSLHSPLDASDADLQKAMDSYLLAGGIKLFRQDLGVRGNWRHHTMLVHESSVQADQEVLRDRVDKMWRASGYLTGRADKRLQKLLHDDFAPVAAARAPELPFPSTFRELAPYVAKALAKVDEDDRAVLLVNGDKDYAEDTPDFDQRPIWRVIVGGNKLSRGYTVEGLTVSYYRRRATSGSTLMQMGRWFGYRPGHHDLVRLFIGRSEPANSQGTRFVDLYAGFEAVCRDEEDFRAKLRRYAPADAGGEAMRPIDIPPLVANHARWLPPVAPNKRYNAVLRSANFGDEWIERTVVSSEHADLRDNLSLLDDRLQGRLGEPQQLRADRGSATYSYPAYCAVLDHAAFLDVLDSYKWGQQGKGGPLPLAVEREFLKGKYIDPEVEDWLVVFPQLVRPGEDGTKRIAGLDMTCVERSQNDAGNRFLAFSTPRDRRVAELVVGRPGKARDDLVGLVKDRRGVLLVYAVYVKGQPKLTLPAVGLCILPPKNRSPYVREFGVEDPDQPNRAVLDPKSGPA